ncbi:MAG: dihydrofolate reductase [Rikenellaceae bacterium]
MISIIVAMAHDRVIGGGNQLLWHISEDLKRFKAITMGCPIIMGRKTYESIGRPLPGRDNIVVSTQENLKIDGCIVVGSLEQALQMYEPSREVFVIGGGEIYAQTIDLAHKLYITEVDATYAGDTFFPEIDSAKWEQTSRESFSRGDKFDKPFSFVDYVRR